MNTKKEIAETKNLPFNISVEHDLYCHKAVLYKKLSHIDEISYPYRLTELGENSVFLRNMA